jgi:hypothetical protein
VTSWPWFRRLSNSVQNFRRQICPKPFVRFKFGVAGFKQLPILRDLEDFRLPVSQLKNVRKFPKENCSNVGQALEDG